MTYLNSTNHTTKTKNHISASSLAGPAMRYTVPASPTETPGSISRGRQLVGNLHGDSQGFLPLKYLPAASMSFWWTSADSTDAQMAAVNKSMSGASSEDIYASAQTPRIAPTHAVMLRVVDRWRGTQILRTIQYV